MKENEALNKVINDALIKAGITHTPFLEKAKDKFKALATDKKGYDILSAIAEWAKTDDIKHYILAPINSGGGAMGGATHWQHTDRENSADWDLWAFIPHCEVWQAVALSLDIEPPKYSHEVRGWPPEYARRLKITSAHIEHKNLPRSKTSINNVDLIAFSTWAQSLGWSLPDRFPIGSKVQSVTPVEALPITQISYEPRNAVGKLAIKALIEIEKHTNNKATAKQVLELLQKWADDGDEPDVLMKSDKPKHAVIWITSDRKEKDYTLRACEKSLKEFDKRRD